MHKLFFRSLLSLGCLFVTLTCCAQSKVEMADGMRSNGKIYVVVAVCLTILIGLFIYLVMLDKKMNRFENNKE